ncbi:MAG: hypothetical protein R2883_03770 [Caldisericia bacterium]
MNWFTIINCYNRVFAVYVYPKKRTSGFPHETKPTDEKSRIAKTNPL